MTNAEKYLEVFGLCPDKSSCPTECCSFCPVKNCNDNRVASKIEWWDAEYRGISENDITDSYPETLLRQGKNIKIEVTEHHTFAKPDDVSDIKFGD